MQREVLDDVAPKPGDRGRSPTRRAAARSGTRSASVARELIDSVAGLEVIHPLVLALVAPSTDLTGYQIMDGGDETYLADLAAVFRRSSSFPVAQTVVVRLDYDH